MAEASVSGFSLAVAVLPTSQNGWQFVAVSGSKFFWGMLSPGSSLLRVRREISEFDLKKAPPWMGEVLGHLLELQKAPRSGQTTKMIAARTVTFFMQSGRIVSVQGCMPCDTRRMAGATQTGAPVNA